MLTQNTEYALNAVNQGVTALGIKGEALLKLSDSQAATYLNSN
jgi:hypothetical protein